MHLTAYKDTYLYASQVTLKSDMHHDLKYVPDMS